VQNLFHWDDVPNDVVAADNEHAVPCPAPVLAVSFASGVHEARRQADRCSSVRRVRCSRRAELVALGAEHV
jgi:hypothetical protein